MAATSKHINNMNPAIPSPLLTEPLGCALVQALFRMARLCAALCIIGTAPPASAHHCGPQVLTLKVGETCPWRITADRTETQSRYAAAIVGDPAFTAIFPRGNFMSIHGDFTITGLAPGTNRLEVFWSYEPTMAAGFCFVEIRVLAADPAEFAYPNQPGSLPAFGPFGDIDSSELSTWLEAHIPMQAKKLVILTECFGGSIALSPQFIGAPNTVVISATVPNQTAKYGGHHDDAARSTRPGPGRTAQNIHETASKGRVTGYAPTLHGLPVEKRLMRESGEWPVYSGGLALQNFSLESVSSTGAVQSRHIVVYMGQPETKTNFVSMIDGVTVPSGYGDPAVISDNADRDAIKTSFSAEMNTTVRTVGGEPDPADITKGQNGWDLPGDQSGLLQAIIEAGNAISNSPNPSAEQFILFVGDHGQQGTSLFSGAAITLPITIDAGISPGWKAPTAYDDLGINWKLDLGNKPSFTIKITTDNPRRSGDTVTSAGGVQPATRPRPGDFSLEIRPANEPPLRLTNFVSQPFDIDGGGSVGDRPGEYWKLFFPVDEDYVFRSLSSAPPTFRLRNNTTSEWTLTEMKLLSGAIARTASRAPRPVIESVRRVSATQIELRVYGPPGETFALESSANLATWQFRRNVSLFTSITLLTEPAPAGGGPLFYRLRWTGP